MNAIAKLPKEEREILFRNTAAKCGLSEGIVEKDFWVCWTLDYLFHGSPWTKRLAFKGGTSLSKCFDLIHRFSEDIDLILDWRLLESARNDPWAERSKNQQDKFNKALNAETETFLRNQFVPRVTEDFAQLLTEDFSLCVDEDDPQTVNFTYPKLFSETSILPMVRLEIGALGNRRACSVDPDSTGAGYLLCSSGLFPCVPKSHDHNIDRAAGAYILGKGYNPAQGGLPHQRKIPCQILPPLL